MTFHDLLAEQIDAAHDAATANDLVGRDDLADWWRWRAHDLQRYLDDSRGPGSGHSVGR